MSHDATNWAIKQRGLKPAAKVVLWHLCDRFHPDHGCFPSQDTLAHDCEMARSAVNANLKVLEDAGLIIREQRIDERTKKRRSTRYRFAFEDDFPCPDSGHGAMSGKWRKPCPENGESHVRNPDTNPVREPVREPVTSLPPGEVDGDRTGPPPQSGGPTARDDVRDKFEAAFATYPGFETDDKGRAWPKWLDLPARDRTRAARFIPTHQKRWETKKKGKFWPFWKYLDERPWERGVEAEIAGQCEFLAPHTKKWILRRIELAMEGATLPVDRHPDGWRALKFMDSMFVSHGTGCSAPAGWRVPDVETVAVQVGSDLYREWRDFLTRVTGRWMPDPKSTEWVHFPACGPPDAAGMSHFVALFSTQKADAAE